MGKKYWWLKLPENFFRQIEIKKLRKIAGGDTYTVIYLKMMLLSLKNEGHIAYDCPESEFIENLALDIDEDEENVAVTVAFLCKHSLLVESEFESDVSLPKAAEAIGSETAAASRMRDMRERKKAAQSVTMLQGGYANVTPALRRDREDIDIELEKEKELDLSSSSSSPSPSRTSFDDDDDGWRTVVGLWTQNITPMTQLIAEKLKALVDEVGSAVAQQAITKAVEHGARNFAYVQAVARNIAAGHTEKKPKSSGLLF